MATSEDIKKFLMIVESSPQTLITSPSGATSTYFKLVEDEVKQQSIRSSDQQQKATALAERVVDRLYRGHNHSMSRHLASSLKLAPKWKKAASSSAHRYLNREDTDLEPTTDVITMDIPLLIRLLEFSKEDAKTDMDLHVVAENLIAASKTYDVLTMDQYDQIVQVNDSNNENNTIM